MDVSEAKRLKALERENAELNKMVADLSLDNRVLNMKPTEKQTIEAGSGPLSTALCRQPFGAADTF
jgi:hypothetical protein